MTASNCLDPPFEEAGASLGSRRSFLAHDVEKVWLIDEGTIDLFLVKTEDGAPVGGRSHVMRLHAGDVLFGIDVGETLDERGLLACQGPDTRLREIPRVRFLRQAFDDPTRNRLIERWVSAVSVAAASDVPPKDYQLLQTGRHIEVPPAGGAALPKVGVVWVRHIRGCSRFLGDRSLPPITGDQYLPLCYPGWLEADPNSLLACESTGSRVLGDADLIALDAFHRVALRCLLLKIQRAEERERTRLTARIEADATGLAAALLELASPLQGPSAPLPEIDSSATLLRACTAIGKQLGVDFKPHPDARRGAPQKDPIGNIARASGLRVRRVILDGDWWRRDAGPMLALREPDGKPIALLSASTQRYIAWDPASATGAPVDAQVAQTLEPFAYVFYRPFPRRTLHALDLLHFGLKNCGRDLAAVVLMGVAAGLIGTLSPILMGIIFDTVIPGAERGQLLQISAFLAAATVASVLFELTRGFAMLRAEGRMNGAVQAALWDRLLSLPVPFFRRFNSGDLAARSLGIDTIRQTLTGAAVSSILSGIFSVFSFGLLFYYSLELALVAAACTALAALATLLFGILELRYSREVSKLNGQISGAVVQFLGGIAKLRVSGTEGRAFRAWAAQFALEKKMALKARKVTNAAHVFTAAFPALSSMVIFWTASTLLSKPDGSAMTTGDFVAFNAAFGQFLAATLAMTSVLISVLDVVPIYERAKPILEALPEADEARADPGELSGSIEVSHAAFRYGFDTPPILRDVTFTARPGEFVAVVGMSGSGKSTIFRLLLGFESPESGSIYYDGQDLKGLDLQQVRRQLGVVLQSAGLFGGDILSNIICSGPYTIDDAWDAARLAGVEDDIRQMPMGMHTVVSEGGGGLSGGQRQRLLIARAIVGKPRIVLFDEATSALDNETQAYVTASLETLQATRIVIAHRLSTIMKADRILVLDKGSVVQSGTYAELVEQEGLFAELARRQLV